MPLWNRSSSLASSGGLSTRTGSDTEQIYKVESSPPQSSSSPSSSGKGFWGWVGEHAKGVGKVAGVVAPLGGAAIGAAAGYLTGGASGAVKGAMKGYQVAKTVKDVVGVVGDNFDKDSGFGKFSRGLTNKRLDEATDKTLDVFTKGKEGKMGQISSIIKDYRAAKKSKSKSITDTNVANSSNGHVPVGYQATSSQGETAPQTSTDAKSVIPTGSTSIPVEQQKKKQPKKNKNKQSKKNQNKQPKKNQNKQPKKNQNKQPKKTKSKKQKNKNKK